MDDASEADRVMAHAGLANLIVQRIARYFGRQQDREDLMQVALMALLKAVRGFDHSRGVPFGAYAALLVKGAVIEEVRKMRRRCAARLDDVTADSLQGRRMPEPGTAHDAKVLLGKLSPGRLGVLLAWLDGTEDGEQAETLGVTKQAVSLARCKALRELREAVEA